MPKQIQIGYRKIQKISKAHYVNLPWIWIHNNNAKQGDCVQIRIEKDGSLNVSMASATPCQERAEAASTETKTEAVPA